MSQKKARYPCDLTDEGWPFFGRWLTLMRQGARRSEYPSLTLNNDLRHLMKAGCWWRLLSKDLLLWAAACQQCHRWFRAGNFEALAHNLSEILRVASDCQGAPAATVLDSHMVRPTFESGLRPGFDGFLAERAKKGSKIHIAAETLGYLLAFRVTPAKEQDRSQVQHLTQAVQEATGPRVDTACVDQGCTGEQAAQAPRPTIWIFRLSNCLRPRGDLFIRTAVGWLSHFRRLDRYFERLAQTIEGVHWLAFAKLAAWLRPAASSDINK